MSPELNTALQVGTRKGTVEKAPLQPGALLTAVWALQRPRALQAPTAPQDPHTAQGRPESGPGGCGARPRRPYLITEMSSPEGSLLLLMLLR